MAEGTGCGSEAEEGCFENECDLHVDVIVLLLYFTSL
jgi:hypothetical protein